MAEDNKDLDTKIADADGGEKLDKVLAHLDSVMSACDSLSKRMDAYEEEKKAKADAEEEEKKTKADKSRKDEGKEPDIDPEDTDPVPVAADEDEDEKKKADKARKDAEAEAEKAKADSEDIKRMIADVAARLPRQMTDAEHNAMADAQARADSVFAAFGKRAPRPLDGETLPRYRRRLVSSLKSHSATWKEVDVNAIPDGNLLELAETQIYADAMAASMAPSDLGAGELREITTTNHETGQRMTRFVGQNTFIASMKQPARRVIGINTKH